MQGLKREKRIARLANVLTIEATTAVDHGLHHHPCSPSPLISPRIGRPVAARVTGDGSRPRPRRYREKVVQDQSCNVKGSRKQEAGRGNREEGGETEGERVCEYMSV